MRRPILALLGLSFILSALAQTWQRVEIDGEQVCVRNTGEQIPSGYVSPSYSTARCNSFTLFEAWLRTAEAVPISDQLVATADQTYDQEDPTGAPSSAITLGDACVAAAFATAGIGNMETGTGASVELAACRGGTNAADGVITEDAADVSMTTGSDTEDTVVVFACTTDSSGSITVTASYMSEVPDNSGPYDFNCVTPADPDESQAPPDVLGLRVIGTDTNEVTLGWSGVGDNHDGSDPASGVDNYIIRLDGTPVDNLAVSNAATGALTATRIGAADGTETNTQSGNDWSMGFGGAGFESTADHMLTVGRDRTGDFSVSGVVTALSSESSFPKLGVGIRQDEADTGSPGCFFSYRGSTTSKVEFRCRLTQGGTATNVDVQNHSLPAYLKIGREGDVLTPYYSSDGGEWTAGGSATVPMSNTVNAHIGITSTSAGTTVTGTLENFNIAPLAEQTRAVSTMVGGTWTVLSEDVDGNTGAAVASVDADPGAGGAAPGKKWNPGWYIKTQGATCQSDQSAYYTSLDNQIANHLPDSDEFAGVYLVYGWGQIERTQGVFTWTEVDSDITAVSALGGKVILAFEYKCFSGISSPEWIAPEDLESEVDTTNTGNFVGVFREPVMDRFITFMQAAATRYDGNATVEIVGAGSENCPSWAGSQPADWSAASYSAQLRRLWSDMASTWEETNIVAALNCNPGDTAAADMEYVYGLGIGVRSPDSHDDGGNNRFKGNLDAVRDYTGTVAHHTTVSSPNLGGKDDILPLSAIQSLVDAGDMTHVSWVLTDSSSGGTKTDIINHIEAGSGGTNNTFEDCPDQYTDLSLGGCQ